MGIPGFTSFVDHNPQLLADVKLSNCKLIIDGNNLYHFLYYYFNISHEYGGDYTAYYRCVKFFFVTLIKCNIHPCVIFDGGHAEKDKKFKTSLRRARERLHLSGFLSHGGRGKVLPILVYETFCNVLDDLNIKHVTCDYEADEQIYALANSWNCPVLSNDSDFFVFDVRAGVVLLDYMNLKLLSEQGQNYINVQMFNLDNLLKLFAPMDRKCMPLMAMLVGNDYVDTEEFEHFLNSMKLPRPSCDKVVSPRRHPKIVSVLLWLQSHKTVESAVEVIIKNTKKGKIDQVKTTIEDSIKSYGKPNSQLADSLHSDFSLESPMTSTLRSYQGQPLPGWFLLGLHRGTLPVFMANALILHRQILLSQIEVMSEPSAYNCSKHVRQIIYGLLLTCDHLDHVNPDDVDNLEPKQSNCIIEYTRDRKTVLKTTIQPVYSLPNGESVPQLQDIPSLSDEKKLDIFCKALNLDKTTLLQENYPAEFLLLAAAVVTWIRYSDPKPNNLQVAALLVGYIKNAGLDHLTLDEDQNIEPIDRCVPPAKMEPSQEEQNVKQGSIESLLREHCTLLELESAHRNIEKYNVPAKHTNVIQFNGPCIHSFSQFQASFLHTTYLAKLLLIPADRMCSPQQVFNGSFLYSFYRELTNRKCPSLFIEELLGRTTYAARMFNSLQSCITLCSKGTELLTFHKAVPTAETKKGKGQKHKKKSKGMSHSIGSTSSMGKSAYDKPTDCMHNLENRFGCLEIVKDQ